ncbi:hypothetical protein [Hymenobacter sp. GOD-10R]|uniref:hypothetical protein n=1 Tax=Hymenobacter sp. GOD-10R TaxID=3093922 RepID=UPI002D794D3B|nr:hypothetical protein [Hymenobacter sp. GOD-10R]WRQ29363.1 hypothetical protein SD425_03680 [Hymenobacter sp. GOD-10R]
MLNDPYAAPFIENVLEYRETSINCISEAVAMQDKLNALRIHFESEVSSALIKLSDRKQKRLLTQILLAFRGKGIGRRLEGVSFKEWVRASRVNDGAMSEQEEVPEEELVDIDTLAACEEDAVELFREVDYYKQYQQEYRLRVGEEPEDMAVDDFDSSKLVDRIAWDVLGTAQENIRQAYARLVTEEEATEWIANTEHRLCAIRHRLKLPYPTSREIAKYYVTGHDPLVASNAIDHSSLTPESDPKMLAPRRRIIILHVYLGGLGDVIGSPKGAAALAERYGIKGANIGKVMSKLVDRWGTEDDIIKTTTRRELHGLIEDIQYIKQYLNSAQQAVADKHLITIRNKLK